MSVHEHNNFNQLVANGTYGEVTVHWCYLDGTSEEKRSHAQTGWVLCKMLPVPVAHSAVADIRILPIIDLNPSDRPHVLSMLIYMWSS